MNYLATKIITYNRKGKSYKLIDLFIKRKNMYRHLNPPKKRVSSKNSFVIKTFWFLRLKITLRPPS